MGNKLHHLTLEDWLAHVFRHPVPEGNENAGYWETNPERNSYTGHVL